MARANKHLLSSMMNLRLALPGYFCIEVSNQLISRRPSGGQPTSAANYLQ
jgi:hypothetical protein